MTESKVAENVSCASVHAVLTRRVAGFLCRQTQTTIIRTYRTANSGGIERAINPGQRYRVSRSCERRLHRRGPRGKLSPLLLLSNTRQTDRSVVPVHTREA